MSQYVIKTKKNSTENVEVAGVGLAGADAQGGIPLERAANVMSELQDGAGSPLSGDKLLSAAKAWAEGYALQVVQVAEKKLDKLAQELGAAPDPPPAADVSQGDIALAEKPSKAAQSPTKES